MSVRHSLRHLLHLLAMPLVIAAVFVAGLAFRLTQDELALPDWLVARIEDRLDRDIPVGDVSLAGVALFYDTEADALRLRLTDVAVTEGRIPVLTLPEARVAFDGTALATGRIRARSVSVEGVDLEVGRDAAGRFTFGTGAGGMIAEIGTPAEWLAALDAALAMPAVADLDELQITGLDVHLFDVVTGLAQEVDDGTIRLARTPDGATVALLLRLPVRTGTADLSLTLERSARGAGLRAALGRVPLSYLAGLLPQVPALTLVSGDVGASGALFVAADGTASPLKGRLEVVDAVLVDRPSLYLDRAAVDFAWTVGDERVEVTEIVASSPELSFAAEGQILLEDGITGPVQMQLRLGETVFDPEEMFERRVEFSSGVIETRLTENPLGLRIGQAVITGPSGTARVSGELTFEEDGLHGALAAEIPRMAVEEVAALWPADIQVQARRWFTNNLQGGMAKDVAAALRFAPGEPADVLASLSFEQASFRFMRFMPPAEDAMGAVQLDGGRLTARVDRGDVPALAPDEVRDAETGTVQIGGSRIVIADLTRRPPRAAVTLRADGDLSDVLGLLDNRPFRLLDRLGRTRNLADGRIEALVTAELPLRPGNAPADIEWGVDAELMDVVATEIVPDRTLRADRLSLDISTAAIEIGGDMTYEGIPFSGTWRQALPPPSTVPLDPTAPPRPRQPLPEPGIVTGTIRATPEGLARIGLRFAALDLSGETEASIAIRLPSGQPAEMTVSSDLRGLSMAFPAIDWSKGAGTAADLELEARLGSPPLIRNLSFDAPGLRASGSVTLRTGGALDRARFDRVRTSWFEGPVTLIGRGAGVPPAISIPSGTADLRAAPFGGGQGGGSGGGGTSSPLEVALNRLQVTDNIALTDLRADLLDGQGRFNGRVNDGQPIAGILAREAGNTVVQISGDDAGGVLRSAGLFRDARGGALRLTLRGTGRAGTYGGQLRIGNIRVRNAPALASLLQTLSVVGILEQLTGEGLFFASVESDFTLRPGDIAVRRASAVGPSMSITADGTYDTGARRLDLQGVVSPIYIVNGLFGALFSRQDEGLFGFTYRLRGSVDDPQVGVNPMSILTPGIFREIFRRPPPS